MSNIKRLESNGRGSPITMHGNTVYFGGQTATDLEGDVTAQAKQAFAKVDRLLALAGTERKNILFATLWLKSMDDYDAMNAVWDAWVDRDSPPSRCCGRVDMADPRMLFEVMVVAAL